MEPLAKAFLATTPVKKKEVDVNGQIFTGTSQCEGLIISLLPPSPLSPPKSLRARPDQCCFLILLIMCRFVSTSHLIGGLHFATTSSGWGWLDVHPSFLISFPSFCSVGGRLQHFAVGQRALIQMFHLREFDLFLIFHSNSHKRFCSRFLNCAALHWS